METTNRPEHKRPNTKGFIMIDLDTTNAVNDEIQVGDTVRSHDFADKFNSSLVGFDLTGPRASYVVGRVLSISDHLGYGYKQYEIEVIAQVAGGEAVDHMVGTNVYPPVNGTKKLMSGTECCGVVKA